MTVIFQRINDGLSKGRLDESHNILHGLGLRFLINSLPVRQLALSTLLGGATYAGLSFTQLSKLKTALISSTPAWLLFRALRCNRQIDSSQIGGRVRVTLPADRLIPGSLVDHIKKNITDKPDYTMPGAIHRIIYANGTRGIHDWAGPTSFKFYNLTEDQKETVRNLLRKDKLAGTAYSLEFSQNPFAKIANYLFGTVAEVTELQALQTGENHTRHRALIL